MSIEFSCPHCRQTVRTADRSAGKKGRCPQCQAIVHIPGPPARSPPHQTPAATGSTGEVSLVSISESGESLQFFCFACGKLIRTTTAVAGKRGRCPHCQEVIDVPRSSRLANEHTPPASAETVPLPYLTPLGGRLKPPPPGPPAFPDPLFGIVPQPNPIPRTPGLEALPPLPSLMDEALPAVGASHELAAAEATPARRLPRQIVNDAGRGGLPWEREPSTESFYETVRYVIFAPQDAFATMRRTGYASPLGFLLLSSVVGSFLFVVEMLVLGVLPAIAIASLNSAGSGEALQIHWDRLVVLYGIFSAVMLLVSCVAGLIGGFLNALVFHLALLACGGADAGFPATYRVVAFGHGSVFLLLLIPVIGPLLVLVLHFVVLTNGFRQAHEIAPGKAFLAVALPSLVGLFWAGIMLLPYLQHLPFPASP